MASISMSDPNLMININLLTKTNVFNTKDKNTYPEEKPPNPKAPLVLVLTVSVLSFCLVDMVDVVLSLESRRMKGDQ